MLARQDSNGIERLAVNVYPEFAHMIGVGRNKAYEIVNSGDIRVLRLGRRIIVPCSSIHEFLSGNANTGD